MPHEPTQTPDAPSPIDPANNQFTLRKLLAAIALIGLFLAPFANFGTRAVWPVSFIGLVVAAYGLGMHAFSANGPFRERLVSRLGFVLAIDALIVLVLFPYRGSQPPSSNFMTGPLWLFASYSVADKIIGAIWAAIGLGLANVFLFAPSKRTIIFAVLGFAVWLGAAVYLSMLYAA
jgi:hypothetical protein